MDGSLRVWSAPYALADIVHKAHDFRVTDVAATERVVVSTGEAVVRCWRLGAVLEALWAVACTSSALCVRVVGSACVVGLFGAPVLLLDLASGTEQGQLSRAEGTVAIAAVLPRAV